LDNGNLKHVGLKESPLSTLVSVIRDANCSFSTIWSINYFYHFTFFEKIII